MGSYLQGRLKLLWILLHGKDVFDKLDMSRDVEVFYESIKALIDGNSLECDERKADMETKVGGPELEDD
ncbi:unnamed protein product [Dovyalis caffra]|uniref:Uncharacterized protein n=1 Tax=Dovyalis caffra TaxID=77055 RepID=A0AAV1SS43_9ROSI|nr:unnamed protein product [Dovyalis caffra]